MLVVAALALGLAIYAGLHGRHGADAALKRATEAAATPTVAVVNPSASSPTDELVLPGTVRAFTDAPIYARASGYLKKWHVDIGSRVTAGPGPRRDRDTRAGPAAPPGPRRPRERAGHHGDVEDHRGSLAVPAQARRGVPPGDRREGQRLQRAQGDRRLERGQREAPGGPPGLPEDHRALRRRHHRPQHRHRRADRRGRGRPGARAVPAGRDQQAARLRLGAPDLRAGRAPGHPDRDHARGERRARSTGARWRGRPARSTPRPAPC